MEELRADSKETKNAGQTNSQFDYVTDVVVVGSGSAGFTAALAVKDKGKDVLLLESTDLLGGCSAKSGGGLWIPNNYIIKASRAKESHEAARAYMDDVIGDVGPASSPERREAYLNEGPKMIEWLKSLGFKFKDMPGYSDYYPHNIGGSVTIGGTKISRAVQPALYDTRKLGPWSKKIRALNTKMAMYNEEVRYICLPTTLIGFWTGFKVFGVRLFMARLLGKKLTGAGSALMCWLLDLALKRNIEIWLESPMLELIEKDGKVIGVVIEKDQKKMRIKANQGVILAAGGFAQNQEMREQYLPHPTKKEWTAAADGDKGDAIRAGLAIGADSALMDEAWGGPVFSSSVRMYFFLWERSTPHGFIVDSKGSRYMNESASYVDCWHWMYEANKKASTTPSYLIIDSQHRNKYAFGQVLPGLNLDFAVKAGTLEELAEKCGIDSNNLVQTAKRFNGFVKTGQDLDFKRGDSAYDNIYSDPRVKPNPNLGSVEKPPFYAIKVYPGELSTKGGLLTDEYARVLDKNGSVIKGLYCVGNSSASVMGKTYPGPGASIGAAMTFGYIAGRHATTLNK